MIDNMTSQDEVTLQFLINFFLESKFINIFSLSKSVRRTLNSISQELQNFVIKDTK